MNCVENDLANQIIGGSHSLDQSEQSLLASPFYAISQCYYGLQETVNLWQSFLAVECHGKCVNKNFKGHF